MAAHQAMACCTPSTVGGSRSYSSSPTATSSASSSCAASAAAAPPSAAATHAQHNSSWLCLRQRLRPPGTGLLPRHRSCLTNLPKSRRILSPSNTTTGIRAVSAPDQECNEEECAPEKEVGKVSMEWKAEEMTKVTGTYPPIKRNRWTGYVEKDTAGQTNIYAVEPTVYVSESAISSGSAGESSEGSQQTVLVAVGLALGLLVGAGVVLQRVSITGSNMAAAPEEALYAGPSLSFYIQKFKPAAAVVEASVAAPVTLETAADDQPAADQLVPSSPAAAEAPTVFSTTDQPDLVDEQGYEQASY